MADKNRGRSTENKKPTGANARKTNNTVRGTKAGQMKQQKKKGTGGFFKRLKKAFAALSGEVKQSAVAGSMLKVGFLCLGAIIIFSSIYLFSNKNAYGVMIGGDQVAIIKKDKKITPEDLLQEAVNKVEASENTKISVNEKVDFKPVHASKKEIHSPDNAINKIADAFTYTVEAMAIKVGDTESNAITMAILKNRAEVEYVENAINEQYYHEGNKIVNTEYVEYYQIETVYVSIDEITSKEKALDILTTKVPSISTYTVSSGDTLTSIATSVGMTIEQLLELNPEVGMNTMLRVGDELTVRLAKPILSVITTEELVLTEVEEKTTERRPNASMPKGQEKTVQFGKEGQADVTYHIIRVNGRETERKEISRDVTTPPVTEIIDVGSR